jgi:ribosome modulation factor
MSAKQRAERSTRAVKEGREAFVAGKKLVNCPYKTSSWGLGAAWQMGWHREQVDARQQSVHTETNHGHEDNKRRAELP